jgi:hypothetical protein
VDGIPPIKNIPLPKKIKIGGIFIRIPPPNNDDSSCKNRESYKGEGRPPFHSPAGLRVENEMKCRFGLAPKKKIFSKFLN